MSNLPYKVIGWQFQPIISLMLAVVLTLTAQGQENSLSPPKVRLKRGQVLEFSLQTPLDSAQAKAGDDVALSLTRPLMVDGTTVLPAGWTTHTKVRNTVHAGKDCKSGRVEWRMSRLEIPHNKKIKLQRLQTYQAKPDGQLADWVKLDSSTDEVRSGAISTLQLMAGLPLFLIFLPLMVLMVAALSLGSDCDHSAGIEQVLTAGTDFYFAISKDADVVPY
jgi:hypothetical protein